MTRTAIARSATAGHRYDPVELAGIVAAHDRRLRLISEQLVPGSFRSPAPEHRRARRQPSRLMLAAQTWLASGQL
ncbi:MAG: hypothetical protein ABI140_03500 [Jatrophihabitantaceae bacterium]